MSKIDLSLWRNPYTAHGLRLPYGESGGNWRIHEAGVMVLTSDWLHRGVCSPFWRLFYGFLPGVWVECAGRRHEVSPERLLILPDGAPFDCGSASGVEHLWLHFSLHLSAPPAPPQVLQVPVDPACRAVAASLRQAVGQRQTGAALHLGSALLHVVFAGIGPGALTPPSRRLQRVLTWLEQNVGGAVNNTRLAAQAGMGVEPFIRWFKAATGRTPASFVAGWRVREACRRLAYGEDTIEQIAETLGFSNRYHFSRVFKQYAGCGPATFRRGGVGRNVRIPDGAENALWPENSIK